MGLIKIWGMAVVAAITVVVIIFFLMLLADSIERTAIYTKNDLLELLGIAVGFSSVFLGPLIGIGGPSILIERKYGKAIRNRFIVRAILILVILWFFAAIRHLPAPPI